MLCSKGDSRWPWSSGRGLARPVRDAQPLVATTPLFQFQLLPSDRQLDLDVSVFLQPGDVRAVHHSLPICAQQSFAQQLHPDSPSTNRLHVWRPKYPISSLKVAAVRSLGRQGSLVPYCRHSAGLTAILTAMSKQQQSPVLSEGVS